MREDAAGEETGPTLAFLAPSRDDVEKICELVDDGSVVVLASTVHALRQVGLAPAYDGGTLRAGNLEIDAERRSATASGRGLRLSPLEFGILTLLMRRDGRAASYAELSDVVWKAPFLGYSQHIHCAVKRLRNKLRDADSTASIEAVRGFGYKVARAGICDGAPL